MVAAMAASAKPADVSVMHRLQRAGKAAIQTKKTPIDVRNGLGRRG
jgi:hypothetical protein